MSQKKTGYFSNMFTVINNAILKNKFLRNIKSIYYYIDAILLLGTKKIEKKNDEKKEVIIVFNLSLGDGAIFNCALNNIRDIYPTEEYNITILCQKGLNKIYEETQLFDEVLPFNFTKAAVSLKERRKLFKKLRTKKYDILIDPIGIEECSTNILISRGVCANKKIGLINKSRKVTCPKSLYKKIYDEIIEIAEKNIHFLEHYFIFFNKLGNMNKKIELIDLPNKKIDVNIPKEYFIVNPSASTEYKRWPLDRYIKITKKIYNKYKLPLLICGTSVDEEVNKKFIEGIKGNVEYMDFTGKTAILEYIYLIKNAKFVITNDTGIYHVAVVSKTPVLVIAGQYTFYKYVNYKLDGKFKPYLASSTKLECANCENRCIRSKEMNNTWPCLNDIKVDDVWKICKEMIDNEYKQHS